MEQHICSCTHKKPITGKYDCLAYVRGNVAYALDALPQTHVEITTGLPWAQNVIYLCTQHHRMFCQGKALHLSYSIPDQLYIEINNVQEDSMNQPIIPFRLCCGQQHLGNVCPDNTIMCEICFGKFTMEQWDNEYGCCKECAKDQTMTIKQMRENNMSSSPVMGSSDRGDKWVKCTKCSKEIGSDWYHPTVNDLRTCLGAAPAPFNRHGSYVKDQDSGVVTNEKTGDKFVFDTSKQHVFNVKNQLKAEGQRINAVGFSKKKGQWYVCWTPKS